MTVFCPLVWGALLWYSSDTASSELFSSELNVSEQTKDFRSELFLRATGAFSGYRIEHRGLSPEDM